MGYKLYERKLNLKLQYLSQVYVITVIHIRLLKEPYQLKTLQLQMLAQMIIIQKQY